VDREDAFNGHGIFEMCRRYGVRAINLTRYPRESVATEIAGGRVEVELSQLLTRETDVFITMPVPKLHMMTGVSLGFKNQWGCLPDVNGCAITATFRARFSPSTNPKPHFAIFDGTWFLDRNGPLDGVPIRMISDRVARRGCGLARMFAS